MQKAFEPEGSRAFIPTISLVALSCGDAEIISGSTRQHQNASSKASFCYSHSVIESCISMASRLHGVASSPR